MAEGALCQALYSRPRRWSEPFARRFIPKLVGARMLLPRPFHLPTSIGRTFFPNHPGHAKSARPRGRLRPSNSPQWSFELFTSGISPSHCGQLSESRRSFQQNASTFSAKRSSHSSKTLRPFQQNTPTLSPKRSSLFSKTPRPFHQNAPAFSTKRSSLFSETPRPFHQNTSTFSPKRDTGRSRVSPCAPPGAWMSRL